MITSAKTKQMGNARNRGQRGKGCVPCATVTVAALYSGYTNRALKPAAPPSALVESFVCLLSTTQLETPHPFLQSSFFSERQSKALTKVSAQVFMRVLEADTS